MLKIYIIIEYYTYENMISIHSFSSLEKANNFRKHYKKWKDNPSYYLGCTHCTEVE